MYQQRAYELAAALRPALTHLYVTYFRMARRSDLTGPQLTILSRLRRDGSARISELARQEGIRMPTVSNALHHLEDRELIERVRDSSDRRGVRVILTKKGIAEFERVGGERTAQLAEMFSTLNDEQLDKLEELIPLAQTLAHNYSADAFDSKD